MNNIDFQTNYYNKFTRLLVLKYKKAFAEKNLKVSEINPAYAIYPASYYNAISQFGYLKNIDYIFIGDIRANERQMQNRLWVGEFVNKFFTENSYLKYSRVPSDYVIKGIFDKSLAETSFIPRNLPDKLAERFDSIYYELLAKAKFCLCPVGDCPWSMRFYEAIMCKAIPIVQYSWQTRRSYAESRLNYKFYLVDDNEFVYREDWAEHNYALFIKYHTLEEKLPLKLDSNLKIGDKCKREGCIFKIHSKKIGGGTHCCICCKTRSLGVHGANCERVLSPASAEVKCDQHFTTDVIA